MTTTVSEHLAGRADLQLTIDQLACHFNLPASQDSPAVTRDRLTRIVRREVPHICGSALVSLPGDDEAVYRIRRLHLDLWVDLQTMSDPDIAQRWGRLLAGAIMRAMQRGGPQQVMRFPSPRHFVTAFLRDMIDGRAWGRWYYAEFKPLRRLSVGAMALELLTSRPDWMTPALTDLAATGHTARLIERWSGDDIARLWAALNFPPRPTLTLQAPGIAAALAELATLWPQVALSSTPDAATRAQDRLRLWLALAAANPEAARDPAVASLIHTLVDLAALVRSQPDLAPVLLMETALYPAALRRIAAGPLADILDWLAPLSATAMGRANLARLAEVGKARSDRQVTQMAQSSPVGSVFLLALGLTELGLWERWQDEFGAQVARRYLFILALKALGRERALLLLGDNVLAAFAGLDEPPIADVRLSSQEEEPAGTWLAELPKIAARWYPPHERNLALGTTRGIHVVYDTSAGCWLAARPAGGGQDQPNAALLWPDLAIDFEAIRGNLTADELTALTAEAAHLQLGQRAGYPWLTPGLDAALSAAASLALRRTAARLPGFTQASPGYLASQFLAQPATLHPDAEDLTVRLSGGPLAVVLRLAALPETLDVPWLPQPLRLALPGNLGSSG